MIYKIHKKNNYTTIDNDILKNKNLSLKGKGLLCLLLSLPESWEYSEVGIENIVKESRDGVRTTLKELEDLHYLTRTRVRNEKGQVKETKYDIYEKPTLEKPTLEKPTLEKPMLDFHTQSNKDISNKETSNKSNNTIFSNSINEDISSYSNSNNFTNNNSIITKRKYFENEEVNELFMEFLQMRKKLKAINSDLAIKKLINILEKYNDEDKIQMIDNSIMNSWKGIFEISKTKQQEVDEKSEKKKLNPPKWVDPKFFDYTMNGRGHIFYKGYEFRYDLSGNLIEE